MGRGVRGERVPRRPLAQRHSTESDELSRAILAYARRRSAELGITVEELARRTGRLNARKARHPRGHRAIGSVGEQNGAERREERQRGSEYDDGASERLRVGARIVEQQRGARVRA